jgi:hypothetical protein
MSSGSSTESSETMDNNERKKNPPTPKSVWQLESPALVPYTDPRKAITVQRTRPIIGLVICSKCVFHHNISDNELHVLNDFISCVHVAESHIEHGYDFDSECHHYRKRRLDVLYAYQATSQQC